MAFLNELLSTQNVNVARFAGNVECDFLECFSNIVILLTMHVHVATAGKSLFTDLTLIRLFSSMSIGVFLKGQLGGKTFATNFALERFCVILCMKYGHVGLHSGLGDKFSTRSAR